MDKDDNPYEVLELTPSATEAEIKKAYRQLARKFHPDKQKTDEDRLTATEHFAKISDAYDLLNDPVRRYDWRMKNESSQPRSSSTSASTATKAASQSATSQTKTTTKTTTSSARAHTPTPSAPRTSQVPMRTTRSSFAPSQPPNVGGRPRSLGPGGGRRAPTGGMARPTSFGSNMAAAAKRASSPGPRARTPTAPLKRASSPGPGMHPRRTVASDIPRRSMAGTSPRRAQSPRPEPGRKNHTSAASITRKPKRRTSLSSEASANVRMPKSVPIIGLDARSDHSVSSRRKPKKPSMGGLDSRSEHTGRMPRRPSMDSASVASVGSRKMRGPGSKNSLNSTNNTRTMRRPSSRESVNSVASMKSCKSAPGLRHKKKSLLGGVSLRGSTANMRNATFDSPSSRSTKSSISRKILRVKPLSGRA